MAIRVPPGGSSLGSFLVTTSALALGGPRSQIFNGWAPDALSGAALDIDFTTGTLDSRVTFARGSTATYYDSSGLVASAASGAPRFDYDPVALTARGLLLEEQRTNVILNSQDYTGANWVNGGGITLGAFVTAPDGTSTGRTFSVTNSNTSSFHAALTTGTMVAGQTYSLSVWAKKSASGGANKLRMVTNNRFAWGTGIGQVFTLTSTWQRFVLTGVVTTSTECNASICDVRVPADGSVDPNVVDLVGNVDLWGAQIELGSAETSYIPTTTVAVTRAADTAEITGTNFSSWWNAGAGTFVAEYRPQSVSGTQPVISVNDTTANEAIRLYGSGTDPKAIIVDGGTTQADLDAGTVTANIFHKLGLAFAANDFAACFNGGVVATDVAGTLPTVTQLQFHTDIAGNVANLHIKRLQFFNTRKSNSELQGLTSPLGAGQGTLAADAAVVASTTGISGSTITDTTIDAGSAVLASTTGASGSASTGPGAIAAQAAAISSTTGVSGSLITDTTLNASPAVVASTTGISGSVITDTTLNASSAVLSSTTGVSGSLITDTTLNASPAVVSSTTGLVRAIANPSALTAQAATLIGIGAGSAAIGAGALGTQPAAIAGVGLARTIGSGALVDGSAALSALAVSGSVGVGSFNVTAADVEGLGYVEQGGVSIMVGGEWQRTTPYVRVSGAWKPATAWANVNGAWKRVA